VAAGVPGIDLARLVFQDDEIIQMSVVVAIGIAVGALDAGSEGVLKDNEIVQVTSPSSSKSA
jgi:hypothetical protein